MGCTHRASSFTNGLVLKLGGGKMGSMRGGGGDEEVKEGHVSGSYMLNFTSNF